MNIYYEPAYLQHHGVKGMKWGRRRYQNKDGSLTPAGKKRYITIGEAKRNATRAAEKARKESVSRDRERLSGVGSFAKANRNALAAKRKAYNDSIAADKAHNRQLRAEREQAKKTEKENRTPEEIAARRKKAIKVGAAVAGTALAAYGAYKVSKIIANKNVNRGESAVKNVMRNKSYAEMNASEAAAARDRLVKEAINKGYRPPSNGYVDFNSRSSRDGHMDLLEMYKYLL